MLNHLCIILVSFCAINAIFLPSTSVVLLIIQSRCTNALNICSILGNGWTLVDVKDTEDATNIHNILTKDWYSKASVFLGATRKSNSDTWKWEDGTQVNTTLFKSGDMDGGHLCTKMFGSEELQADNCGFEKEAILCQRQSSGTSHYP